MGTPKMFAARRSLGLLLPSLALIAALLLPGDAAAFRLAPIEMEFEPAGRNATQIFRVENEGDAPVAVEVTVHNRAMAADGKDILTEADDHWIVFPEQIILQPKETQSVRVQYIGPPGLTQEMPYRLIARQLPIDIGQAPAQGGQVRLLVEYVASLYVMPAGVKPDVQVVSAQPAPGPDGTRMLELVLTNRGSTRQILREPVLSVEIAGQRWDLRGPALEGLAGENMLAGATRRFLVPWPNGATPGAVMARLQLS